MLHNNTVYRPSQGPKKTTKELDNDYKLGQQVFDAIFFGVVGLFSAILVSENFDNIKNNPVTTTVALTLITGGAFVAKQLIENFQNDQKAKLKMG